MCGIAGLLHDDPGVLADPAPVARMNAVQAHRGPDAEGLWHEGPIALGHRRLSVLDLTQHAAQPMHSPCGRHVLVFNGEIYNYPALRAVLEQEGDQFQSSGDTEVLLAALARWGLRALDRLAGMFAFAWYDRAEGRLVLVRDRLGIKPLYYTHRDGMLAFASELSPLRAAGFTGDAPDSAALDAYFTYLYIPAPDTIFAGVHKLCPGELLIAQRGQVSRQRWWRPVYQIDESWTLESAAARYLDLLDDSVRQHRVSDVPLGAFLSGGLDSSTVTAVLAHQSSAPIKTFSIGFDDAHANELQYARAAAEHLGTDHTEAILHPDMAALLPTLVQHFGEPFADSSALPTWLVSRLARRAVTVALTGDGGDELFAGYTWTRLNHWATRYAQWPAPLRHMAGLGIGLLPGAHLRPGLQRFHNDSFLPPGERYRRRHTCLNAAERLVLLHTSPGEDRFLAHWRDVGNIQAGDQMLYVDTCMYLPDDVLTKVDRMSMAHALEARVPLLDHRLVEFAATVPFTLKLSGGISKRLAKHAAARLLPPALLRQRKQGFAIPIHAWFRGALREPFQDLVLGPDARSAALLDRAAVQHLLDAHLQGRAERGHALWAILFLEQWLRTAPEATVV
jgi:asparagine synthase (glutamine-hydrolysing)